MTLSDLLLGGIVIGFYLSPIIVILLCVYFYKTKKKRWLLAVELVGTLLILRGTQMTLAIESFSGEKGWSPIVLILLGVPIVIVQTLIVVAIGRIEKIDSQGIRDMLSLKIINELTVPVAFLILSVAGIVLGVAHWIMAS